MGKRYPIAARIMTEPERAWLAAAVDGEGTIGFHTWRYKTSQGTRTGHVARMSVANTCMPFVERVRELAGVGSVWVAHSPSRAGFKPLSVWRATRNRHVYEILVQIEPHLIAKKAQAQNAIAYCRFKMGVVRHRMTEEDHLAYAEYAKRGSELNRIYGRDQSRTTTDPAKVL